MKLVKFKQSNDILLSSEELTEDVLEDDYIVTDKIPILRFKDSQFAIVCAELNYEELKQVKATGKVYIRLYIEDGHNIGMIGDNLLEPKLGEDYFDKLDTSNN